MVGHFFQMGYGIEIHDFGQDYYTDHNAESHFEITWIIFEILIIRFNLL